MKKKVMVIVGIVIIAIILVIAGWKWGKGKTDWYKSAELFGPLNLMELDEELTSNDSYYAYYLNSVQDFRVEGQTTIRKGEVKIIVSMNDQYLFEQDLNSEVSQFESEIYTDQEGELQVDMIISDDADGEYTIAIYTRKMKYRRLLERIKRFIGL